MSNQSLIVAVDFDGVLCRSEFPGIGAPNYDMISLVRQMQDAGVETILWTTRVGNKLYEAVEWCKDRGLHFTSINDGAPSNLKEFSTNPRKVMAHIYIDDNSPWFKQCEHDNSYTRAVEETIRRVKWFLKSKGVEI